MKELILSGDRYRMNWIEGRTEWSTVKCALPLDVEIKSEKTGDIVRESYIFTNNTEYPLFAKLTDIGIYTPFNDDYTTASECKTNRCHTHIWCGGEVSYVMALRMGGEAPHLGLVLTGGSLGGYSVERDLSRISNDRGDFIMHPAPFSLAPGERYTVSWTLFPHNGKADFFDKALAYCTKFIRVSADRYVLFEGERANVTLCPNFNVSRDDVSITLNGEPVPFEIAGNKVCFSAEAKTAGELKYDICAGGVHTFLRLLAVPGLYTLVRRRCQFIARRQQCHKPGNVLDGAYLTYDNEEEAQYYSREFDRNGGRERVGMGVLIAAYLQKNRDSFLEQSLKKYIDYVERELVDTDTGEVFNDCGRDNHFKRLYNPPWFAQFFTELYRLYGDRKYILTAYRILMFFYSCGGERFYSIELPAVKVIDCLRKEHLDSKADALAERFLCHADNIAKTGTDYPASEVNYEQSIAAPGADVLLKACEFTGDEKYLQAAERQLEMLELFNGSQPDYHLYEVAIRHWDGFWFGKRRLYGDTFPHYWSALTGNVYLEYARLTGNTAYLDKAEASFRGVLSLFTPDGRASCACVYPVTVNGEMAGFFDPYANDQDWGLYFMLRYAADNPAS